MLYSYPARFFTYFQQLETPIVEGLAQLQTYGPCELRCVRRLVVHVAPNCLRARCAARTLPIQFHALDDLCHETNSLVFAIAPRILSHRTDAEEVAADVYTQVWKTAATYNARPGNVGRWLVSIARTRAIDLLRSRAARLRSEAGLYLECSSAVNPEKRAVASQTRHHIHQAVHALPVQQRRAIELAYFSGLPMSAIAEQLREPVGTIKTRVRAGLLKLRRSLASVA